ncbi:MAG: NAD kinase [Solobacterium sp.]|nr:NAD kinase [Solobacterium sp.]
MNKKYAVSVRPDEHSYEIRDRIEKVLTENGYERDDENPSVVFTVGGDGTFLYAVHQYLDKLENVCFYGLHTGTLGFYTDYRDSDFDEFMDFFLKGKVTETDYPLLEIHTETQSFYALNEVRVENAARTQKMNVYINDRLFETYRGTGMCLATQLGSTAYNRSLGGAVIQEGLDVVEMSEIAGIHHIKFRSLGSPIILKSTARVTWESESFQGALLGVDAEVYPLDDVKRIDICESPVMRVRMLRGRKIRYLDRLQSLF